VNVLPITFLSDYGHRDEFVGVCHGVIERIAPGATVIDLAHGLPPRDVRTASLALRNALAYLPRGVHLAVVDPKVGTPRRPLAVRCHDGHQFVGPDNGLLWPAVERCGGIDVAIDIAESPYRLEPVSATFHGRDLFAPVAARLALETPIENAGSPLSPEQVARLEFPEPAVGRGSIRALVLAIDRYGNVELNAGREHMREAGFSEGDVLSLAAGPDRRRALFARTFADVPVGEAVLYEDSSQAIAVALNGGSAADALGVVPDAEVELSAWAD
jgi:S-adenosyl-L-methionine hydrolase (adenosine-forming)